jgi:hypothetical protein
MAQMASRSKKIKMDSEDEIEITDIEDDSPN